MFSESNHEEIQTTITWIISFSLFVMITALLGCVCGCRKSSDKEDWLGKEGKVKQLNTGLNGDDDCRLLRLNLDPNKTNVANRASTANRSLPDIPTNEIRDSEPPWDPGLLTTTSDNCSELYATVGDAPLATTDSLTKAGKKRQAPSAPSTTDNSQSEATPPGGSKVSSHQYAKLTHPYARVKPPPPKTEVPQHHASSSTVTQPSIELESSETTPGVQGGSETTLSSSTDQPVPPPRARRSSSQSNLYQPPGASGGSPGRPSSHRRSSNTLPSSSSSSSRVSDTIAAAPAISGQISASQELPYITLPIPDSHVRHHNSVPSDLPTRSSTGHPPPELVGEDYVDVGATGGQNFSGDSQDSSKGYTSISVREPLASIRAQTSAADRLRQLQQRRLDPHYATVSDDSDEMYAAIEERSSIATYAQIVPPPPSVDSLRTRVAENHSRQASSSSAASSVAANVGSPKPEKRQANSPLPPTPLLAPTASTSTSTSSPPSTPVPAPPTPLALEDMYAKVIKKKSSNPSAEATPTHTTLQPPPEDEEPTSLNTAGYESLNPTTLPPTEPNYESVSAGYAKVKPPNDPGYEHVGEPPSTQRSVATDPNYEELRGVVQEPNYELLNGEPNYEPLNNTPSSEEPNYECVGGGFSEPPYEQLNTEHASGGSSSSKPSSSDILYATVNKGNKKSTTD